MQKKKPEDYVISTGKTYSVRDFINACTKFLKWKTKWTGKGINEKLINLENNKILVKINKNFYRPAEVNFLKGNSSKARKLLKWSPKTNLKKLVRIMMSDELKFYIKMPNKKKINSL
jgi:GDPmannose 4,6-dehydratase